MNFDVGKKNIKDLTLEEIEKEFESKGIKKFRASQVYNWIHKNIVDFEQMNNIPELLKNELFKTYSMGNMKLINKQESLADGTIKYLFEAEDGERIETVFMKYKHGNSICISSQAGCRMGCTFCASTIGGLSRNLSSGEMLEQILATMRDTNQKISNVVIMGTGEPFDNYENLSKFINLLNAQKGLNIGMRSITVSTCGLIPFIEKFANDFKQVNLAISLHYVDDIKRSDSMPVNKKYNIEELIKASKKYIGTTKRRITFEYALVKGENDSVEDAEKLSSLVKGINCHINLIPLNEVAENTKKSSNKTQVKNFKEILENNNIQVTVRRKLGADIDAACGQLRLKTKYSENNV